MKINQKVKNMKKESADKKFRNGTVYRDSEGKTHKRVAYPGSKRGDAYCSRTANQTDKNGNRTPKILARRKAWGCKGSKSSK